MTQPKKKTGRKDQHSVQFFTSARLAKALTAFLKSREENEPLKKKAFLETAVREALAKRGFWPPPEDQKA